eukprot:gene22409-28533_t
MGSGRSKLRKTLRVIIQDYLYGAAKHYRVELVTCRELNMRPDSTTSPVAARYSHAFRTLVEHSSLNKFPQLIRVVLQCHAAVSLIPRPMSLSPPASSTLYSSSSSSSSSGNIGSGGPFGVLDELHTLVSVFLIRVVHNGVVTGVLDLNSDQSLRNQLISSLAPIAICEHTACRNGARFLLQTLLRFNSTILTTLSASNKEFAVVSDYGAVLRRHIKLTDLFNSSSTASVVENYLEYFLEGLHAGCSDQNHDALLQADDSSVRLTLFSDEALETALSLVNQHLHAAQMTGGAPAKGVKESITIDSYKRVAKRLSKIMLLVAVFPSRVALPLTLCTALQIGLHHRLTGCFELLKANDGEFLYLGEADRSAIFAGAMSGNSSSSQIRSTTSQSSRPQRPDVIDITNGDSSMRSATQGRGQPIAGSRGVWPVKPPEPLSYLDELALLEEQEEREVAAQNQGRNKLVNMVNKPAQVAAKFAASGWEVINRTGKQGNFQQPLVGGKYGASKPLTASSSGGGSTSSSGSEKWRHQMEELKQQKLEARLKTSANHVAQSSSGSVDSAGDNKKRKFSGGSSSLLRGADGDDAEDEGSEALSARSNKRPVRDAASASSGGAIDLKQFMPSSVAKPSAVSASCSGAAPTMKWGAGSIEAIKAAYSAKKNGADNSRTIAESIAEISVDGLFEKVLDFQLQALCVDEGPSHAQTSDEQLLSVPIRFMHEDHYLSTFRPLMVEEVKAAIGAHLLGAAEGGGGRKPHGQQSKPSSGEFKITTTRCVFRSSRHGCAALEEAQVSVVRDEAKKGGGERGSGQQHDLVKEDLLMVMRQPVPSGVTRYRDLIKLDHALAVVSSAAKKRNEMSSSGGNKLAQQTLLVLRGHDNLPLKDELWHCVPVMGLSTFIREWLALQSMASQKLMPLAPYLLKGSPVVSSTYLSSINDAIELKLKNLIAAHNNAAEESRMQRFNDALLFDLASLVTVQIDGSVLKNTGIAKTLMRISNKSVDRLFSVPCVDLAGNLITKWKEQVKMDNKASTLMNMKGGKLVEMPASGEIAKPRCLPGLLWTKLCSSYNSSQLFAIKYVSDQFEGGQDTRVALVQGPPGTGKTSTILGMVSALLHRSLAGSGMSAADMPFGIDLLANRQRLLLCAPSNGAVDEILTRLSTNGVFDGRGETRHVKIVRLGEPLEGATEAIRSLTLDFQVDVLLQTDPMFLKLGVTQKAIVELEREISAVERGVKYVPHSEKNEGDAKLTSAKFHAVDWKPPAVSTDGVISAPVVADTRETRLRKLKNELGTQRQVRIWAELGVEKARNLFRHSVMSEADIVAGTLSGSGRQQFLEHVVREDVVFDTAIIDEAAQTTEPSTLIPLKFGCRRLVLVGDPRQLPATVLSRKAERAGLGLSLFERLERANHEVVMLTIQYRMHPEIRLFPSQCFYQGMLVDSDQIDREVAHYAALTSGGSSSSAVVPYSEVTAASAVVSADLILRGVTPVTFYDVYSGGGEMRAGKSYKNEAEGRHIIALLEQIHTAHAFSADSAVHRLSVAIITPYNAQVRLLQDMLRESSVVAAIQSRRRALGSELVIEVNSIDGFQGREKDVVLFSCVRSNGSGGNGSSGGHKSIGFVADERRMNVAITRAKKALLIVGDSHTLRADELWGKLIKSLKERGLVRDTGKK